MQNRKTKLDELKSKHQPSTFSTSELLLALIDPQGPESQKVKQHSNLQRHLEQPRISIEVALLLAEIQIGYLQYGLLAQDIKITREISPLAKERKPYLVDRLNLMEELKTKHSTLRLKTVDSVDKPKENFFAIDVTKEEMAKSAFGQGSNTARRLR